MELRMIDDPRARLRAHERPDECWMWCCECTRFFQYGRARRIGDFTVGCPFPGCCGYGVGFHLFLWDDMREPDDPRWPSSEAELEHGMKSPDMEPFYAARLEARLDALAGAFERSAACARELGGEPHRHLRSFLRMMARWDSDLTESHTDFSPDAAEFFVRHLPRWAGITDPLEAPSMARELRAFGAFAFEEDAITDARHWRDFLNASDLEAWLRASMEEKSQGTRGYPPKAEPRARHRDGCAPRNHKAPRAGRPRRKRRRSRR